MGPALTYRASVAIIGGAIAFSVLAGFWVFGASATQLSSVSAQLIRVGGLGLLFVAGVVAGVQLTARCRGGWGDDGGGRKAPQPSPPSDHLELELRQIIEEELARRR